VRTIAMFIAMPPVIPATRVLEWEVFISVCNSH
jgi:hypothetical protein